MIPDNITVVREIDSTAITVYPIADVHVGSPQHNTKKWEAFLDRVANEDDSYLILAGDMLNNTTAGSVGIVYEEALPPAEQKRVLYDQLWQVKDKILCGVMGNHEARSVRAVDNDPLLDVFTMLGIQDRYRRNAAFLRVKLKYAQYTFCVVHGASRAKVEKFAASLEGIDCLITGHTHNSSVELPAKIVMPPRKDIVEVNEMYSVVVPSWLDLGGYGLSKMYTPKTTCKPQAIRLQAPGRYDGARKIQITSGDLF